MMHSVVKREEICTYEYYRVVLSIKKNKKLCNRLAKRQGQTFRVFSITYTLFVLLVEPFKGGKKKKTKNETSLSTDI